MDIKVNYPPLVDCISAYQNGLLDAVNNRVGLSSVLVAAEERVLTNSYCRGYVAGSTLVNRND